MFNSRRIMCTSGLSVLTHEKVLGEKSTRDDEKLTGEYDLLRSVLVTHKGVFLECSSQRKITC